MNELSSRRYPVTEHFHFQRRIWVVERIGWFLLAVITLLGILGVFGVGGVLSTATAANTSLSVSYERFQRETRLTHFTFHFAPGAKGSQRLQLGRDFRANYEVTSIQPAPAASASEGKRLVLTFIIPGAADGRVTIWARPHRWGRSRYSAQVDSAPPLEFSAFVYP